MKFYDQHCHSYLSFDSKANPFDYIKENTEIIALTEHLDLENPVTGRDDIPDFKKMLDIQEQMKNDHGVQLLMGVELGYAPGQEDNLRAIINQYDFDLILLSCHHRLEYDYMDSPTKDSPKEMMDSYVNQLIEAVETFPEIQIFAHFDYGFRVHKFLVKDIKSYEKEFAHIFKQLIKNDIALEINSRSIASYNNLDLYQWAIPLYQKLGGKLFALGSDCHIVEDNFLIFPQLIDLLKSHDVKELALFQRQDLQMLQIDEIKKICDL